MSQIREQEFYATARRLHAERVATPKLLDAVLHDTPRDAWPGLASRPDLQTCGAIDHLGDLVAKAMTRDPAYALAAADLGTALAEVLPETIYPPITLAQTRALAWKNRGKVLSYLARHEEAVYAFAEAERRIEAYSTLPHDRAVIRLNLAITYLDLERYAEAVATLAACKAVFQAHGDDNLFVLSAFYEGTVLQRLHKYREARETYLLLLASNSNITKPTLAALHQTIGLCSTEVGDFDAAETHLRKPITLHSQLNQPLDAVKGEHGRGLLLLRRGFLEQGIAHLRTVRHRYLKASLAEEAGLCGLEIVGGLLELGTAESAEALARTILNEFLAASLSSRAVTALGYLSEAIASRKAQPGLASHVRQYVLSLRTAPEREFVEPSTAEA